MDTMEFVSASFFSSIVILQGGVALVKTMKRKLQLKHTHTYTHTLTHPHFEDRTFQTDKSLGNKMIFKKTSMEKKRKYIKSVFYP